MRSQVFIRTLLNFDINDLSPISDFDESSKILNPLSTEGENKNKKKPITMLTLFSIWSVAKVTLIQVSIKKILLTSNFVLTELIK